MFMLVAVVAGIGAVLRWAPAAGARATDRASGRLGARAARNPARIPAAVRGGGATATAWTGRSSRGSARSSATTGATPTPRARRRAPSTPPAPAGRCSSSPRPGRSTGWTATATAATDRWDPADAIYGGRQLPARLRRAGRLPRGDLRLQPRRLVRGRGRALGGAVSRRAAPSAASSAGSGEGGLEDGLEGADTRLAGETATPVRFIAGERAMLAPGDGHVALVPAGVPADVQAMVVAGNELQELPYGPDGHPDPRGAHRRGLLEHASTTCSTAPGCGRSRKSSETTRSPRTTSTGARPAPGAG